MIEKNSIIHGDCLQIMGNIESNSIDSIMTDMPYEVSNCKWDFIIPIEPLWKQYKRILKKNGVIVLTAVQPFSSMLIMSNLEWFKYELIWEKQQGTNPLLSKKQPMRCHENILIFSNGTHTYNPQMRKGKPYYKFESKTQTTGEIIGSVKSKHKDNPEGLLFPRSVLYFKNERKQNIHPVQKPLELFDYLVKTYTNEGDLILDNAAGSGTTAVAAINNKRNFIIIEKDESYYQKAKLRIDSANKEKNKKFKIV